MSWPKVYAVFATGVVAAFLIGKVPAALPILRAELGLSLFEAGLIVAMFSLIAAVSGIVFGALSDRLGQCRLAASGLVIAALSGVFGAQSTAPDMMIISRVGEGLGFFMLSVSLPGMIIRLSDDENRQAAMGLWGAYLPLGAGLVLLTGGALIASIGWRGLWLAIAFVGGLMLLPMLWAAPAGNGTRLTEESFLQRLRVVIATRGAILLAVTFGCYSGQYSALTSFVPLILVEQAGWSLPAATFLGALVMLANVTGNIAAGLLLGRGVARATLLMVASAVMAAGAVLMMLDGLPLASRLAGAICFSSFGGLIPGALFAGVARHAPTPSHVSGVNGLMLQCVAIGQLVGPVATTFAVHQGGGEWSWALIYLLPMAALTMAGAILIARLEREADVAAAPAAPT